MCLDNDHADGIILKAETNIAHVYTGIPQTDITWCLSYTS